MAAKEHILDPRTLESQISLWNWPQVNISSEFLLMSDLKKNVEKNSLKELFCPCSPIQPMKTRKLWYCLSNPHKRCISVYHSYHEKKEYDENLSWIHFRFWLAFTSYAMRMNQKACQCSGSCTGDWCGGCS